MDPGRRSPAYFLSITCEKMCSEVHRAPCAERRFRPFAMPRQSFSGTRAGTTKRGPTLQYALPSGTSTTWLITHVS
eukprot:5124208-Pyramimonas_sp.AAC.1